MSEQTFKLRKSDVKKSDILVPLWVWTCPLCWKQVISHSVNRVLQYAKLHLERLHKLKVEVVE